MTEDAWVLLSQMDAPVANRKGKTRRGPEEVRALAESFIDLMLRFFMVNSAYLAMLRHETLRDEDGRATSLISENVAPLFDAVVARLDEMRARSEIRRDVEPRQLVLSGVAMIAFPFLEESFVRAIWPAEQDVAFATARKAHVVEMLLARMLPP
jgi:hypothetical protein